MDLYLFAWLIGVDMVYKKTLVEEIFSSVHLHSTTKHNQNMRVNFA